MLIDSYSTRAFWYSLVCARLCQILNLKYIPILHGGNYENRLRKSPLFSDLVFKNSYSNVAVSHYLKDVFEKYGYDARVIPNNLNIADYNYKIRSEMCPKNPVGTIFS